MYQYILASNSPRREEILKQAGLFFTKCPSEKEEVVSQEQPKDIVMELASMKALDVAKHAVNGSVIIGADTVVVNAGSILGKPKDEIEAINMIMNLQGHAHQVYTGVCIVVKDDYGDINAYPFYQCTKVIVSDMTKEEAMEYVLTKEPMDKAGAYAIQGKFAKYIEGIEGDYYNVVGFPIAAFRKKMMEIGLTI